MKKDITTVEDVTLLVHSFYDQIRKDDLLGGIFNGIIQDRWGEHLEKMVRFWQSILLNEVTYSGSPFVPHAHLPVDREHFDRWRSLFFEVVDTHFEGEIAEEAKRRAALMAELFLSKIRHLRVV